MIVRLPFLINKFQHAFWLIYKKLKEDELAEEGGYQCKPRQLLLSVRANQYQILPEDVGSENYQPLPTSNPPRRDESNYLNAPPSYGSVTAV